MQLSWVGEALMNPTGKRRVQAPRCRTCEILLDMPCTNLVCDGHRNESIGDVCVYCATNERAKTLYFRAGATLFFSSLGDIGEGED